MVAAVVNFMAFIPLAIEKKRFFSPHFPAGFRSIELTRNRSQ
jgi:hypothetical protein